jgi:nicotinate-nucleotide adenylyltransferase
MHIGLYFGSFNPVHIGHLIIANFVANNTSVNQVWYIISPHNPLKKSSSLLNEYHRLHLVKLAIDSNNKFKASDIEFKLPRPSYTIDTLTYLHEKYPTYTFSVIIGSDSLLNINKWKNGEVLLTDYHLIVYQRPGFIAEASNSNISLLKAPLLEISSTEIRKLIQNRKSIQYLVPEKVVEEIERNGYYK